MPQKMTYMSILKQLNPNENTQNDDQKDDQLKATKGVKQEVKQTEILSL